MRSNHQAWRPLRTLPLRPGVNFSKLEVGGGVAGVLFIVGSAVVMLIGLPALLPAYLSSLALGVALAFGLGAWYRRHLKR